MEWKKRKVQNPSLGLPGTRSAVTLPWFTHAVRIMKRNICGMWESGPAAATRRSFSAVSSLPMKARPPRGHSRISNTSPPHRRAIQQWHSSCTRTAPKRMGPYSSSSAAKPLPPSMNAPKIAAKNMTPGSIQCTRILMPVIDPTLYVELKRWEGVFDSVSTAEKSVPPPCSSSCCAGPPFASVCPVPSLLFWDIAEANDCFIL
mmetsp:Transcript_31134/g.73381  ORF Transcript_31134/g.73381 Transcript_31134/m.73381 type:complete len:203 (-) Transcript_31134:177-785(-)